MVKSKNKTAYQIFKTRNSMKALSIKQPCMSLIAHGIRRHREPHLENSLSR
jgi:hypothetical protein